MLVNVYHQLRMIMTNMGVDIVLVHIRHIASTSGAPIHYGLEKSWTSLNDPVALPTPSNLPDHYGEVWYDYVSKLLWRVNRWRHVSTSHTNGFNLGIKCVSVPKLSMQCTFSYPIIMFLLIPILDLLRCGFKFTNAAIKPGGCHIATTMQVVTAYATRSKIRMHLGRKYIAISKGM